MKQTYIILFAAMLALASCNNESANNSETTTTPVDTVASAALDAGAAATSDAVSTLHGGSLMPGVVFEEINQRPISGATVVAKEGTSVIETVTSGDDGKFVFTKLKNGTTYTYTSAKTGFDNTEKSGVYEGESSLPDMGMKSK